MYFELLAEKVKAQQLDTVAPRWSTGQLVQYFVFWYNWIYQHFVHAAKNNKKLKAKTDATLFLLLKKKKLKV